jgi:tetratricopeptide (TPR) repeat protein
MITPVTMTHCPTEETLAAFIDDRLDATARLEVTSHLVECADCREIVMMADDFRAPAEGDAPSNVVVAPFARPRWIAAALALAAALAIAFWLLPTRFLGATDMDALVAAADALPYRPSVGRLAGGFPYKEPKRVMRGGEAENDLAQKQKLYDALLDLEGSTNLHALGVGKLLQDEKTIDEAVSLLDRAWNDAQGEDRDRIAVDLAAALIARGRRRGSSEDHQRALALSTEVWNRTRLPEAAWNRAAALEQLSRKDEAIRAWDDYLRVDATSDWAKEATERKNDLQRSAL